MKNEELIQLVEAVDNINADLYNQCTAVGKRGKVETDPWAFMRIKYNEDHSTIIEYLGQVMYDSEQNERKRDKDADGVYEAIEPFLRGKANEFISKLQKIKL